MLLWIDPLHGPILGVEGHGLTFPDPAWWLTNCFHVRSVGGSPNPNAVGPILASGISIAPELSLRSALGEALERYSAFNASHVTERAFCAPPDPELLLRFPTCLDAERAHPCFSSIETSSPLTMVKVESLADSTPRWVPAGHVDLSFQPYPNESPASIPVSTGFAFHADLCAAVWTGLCEVAERDALMVNWWCRLRPPVIVPDPDLAPDHLRRRLERLEQVGLRLLLFDFTLDFPAPTVVAVITAEHHPYLTVGSSCKSDPMSACSKAIDEAVSARLTARSLGTKPVASLVRFDWVNDFVDHIQLYATGELQDRMAFLQTPFSETITLEELAGRYRLPAPSSFGELRRIASRLVRLGLTALWCEVTAPEFRRIGAVAKVVVPEMVPLSRTHSIRWLGTPRLARFLGRPVAELSDFQDLPHPFA
ncbi:MAG: YcaO-like family protein [Isosphaeraceae bacterium]